MQVFVIADAQFGHAIMVGHHNRPEQFDRVIVDNWNSVVDKDDVDFHLSDVAFGRDVDTPRLMKRLNGRKILCLGNHDRQEPEWYMERGFAFACAYFVYRGVCFSHKPVTPMPPECVLNVHGHFHRGEHRDAEYRGNDYYQRHRDRYRLVQIEDTLAPIPLDEILTLPTARSG